MFKLMAFQRSDWAAGKGEESMMQTNKDSKMQWFLTIVAVLAFIASAVIAILGHRFAGGLVDVVGIICLIVANPSQIAKLKLSLTGFDMETHNTLAQAKDTLVELRALGALIARQSLSFVKRQGRNAPYTDDQQDAIREDVMRVLDKLGVSTAQREEAETEWHQWVEFDYVYAILGGSARPQTLLPVAQDERRALLESAFRGSPAPEVLRDFLARHQVLTLAREEYIKDYAYYREHRKHRRPSAWHDRDQLGQLIVVSAAVTEPSA